MKTILRNKSDYEALRKHYLNVKNRVGVSTYDLHILEPEQYPCIAVTKINDNARRTSSLANMFTDTTGKK
jgi:hypothetical protein